MSDFERQPIFWTSPRPGFNTRDRERVRLVDGERIVERHPQHGHAGDYENRKLARGQRYITVIRHEGHVVFLVLTNGAAHLDPNNEFGLYQRAKMQHFGWFPLGACPIALLANDLLQRGHFRDQSIVTEAPCQPKSYSEERPCPHVLAELEARRAAWAKKQDELAERYKDQGARQVEAINAQTERLVEMLTDRRTGRKAKDE